MEAALARKLKIKDLSRRAAARAAGWDATPSLRWVDTVAWIATRQPELMMLLRGWRYDLRSEMPEASESGLRDLAVAEIGVEGWKEAEHELRQTLDDRTLVGTTASGSAAVPESWAKARGTLDSFLGEDAPGLFFATSEVMTLWEPSQVIEEAAEESKRRKTNKEPDWYPVLKHEYDAQDKRQADFILRGQPPPNFPKSTWFRTKLLRRGFPESMLALSTVRSWVARLNKEHGR
jgi:hypothetical protein